MLIRVSGETNDGSICVTRKLLTELESSRNCRAADLALVRDTSATLLHFLAFDRFSTRSSIAVLVVNTVSNMMTAKQRKGAFISLWACSCTAAFSWCEWLLDSFAYTAVLPGDSAWCATRLHASTRW